MSALRVILTLVVATTAAGLAIALLGMPPTQVATGGQTAVADPASPTAAPATPVESSTPSPPPTARPTAVARDSLGLSLDPDVVTPGAELKLSGSGFAPLERLDVVLSENGLGENGLGENGQEHALGELTATESGALSGEVRLPTDLAPGRHVLRARSATGTVVEATVVALARDAYFDLRRYAVHGGDILDLVGGGFGPGERVNVYIVGSPRRDLATLVADPKGEVSSSSLAIPDVKPGVYTLTVEGAETGVAAERQISVLGYTPWIILSTYALRPGESVDVSGNGFAPGEDIRVLIDGARAPAQTIKADDQGRALARGAFVARPGDVGKHALKLVGDRTRAEAGATFEVLAYVPKLSLTTYAGPPDTTVAFDGEGFEPGETVRVFVERAGQRTEVASFPAGSRGAFAGAGGYQVPADAPVGKLRFVVVGDLSRATVSQDFDVQEKAP